MTIFLTPSKKRRSAPVADAEIWRWTLTADAIASCFVQDIYDMRENTTNDFDFFWLKRVPCRSVRIAGLLVGVQVYEKRIMYSVDDGTAVIDCAHRPVAPPRSPTKPTNAKATTQPPVELTPIAHIGASVRLIGKVIRKFQSKQISIDHIECCTRNDEPIHWRKVRALHESFYSLPDPFEIPEFSQAILQEALPAVIVGQPPQPQTPSSIASTPGPTVASSPAKSMLPEQQTPPKLRHPSRLHSRDLTGNTFRIYIKHYMDHAPDIAPPVYKDSDTDLITTYLNQTPLTPTKRSRHLSQDLTPKARPLNGNMDSTPRSRIPDTRFISDVQKYATSPATHDPTASMRGFTLSYLRRVPELSDMAKRVVAAEAKRRTREERRKAKESCSTLGLSKKPMTHPRETDVEKVASRMKRLFKWAIVQLIQEGSIVLWDGPVRPCMSPPEPNVSGLWKVNSSNSTMGANSTVFSSISGITQLEEDLADEDLSDPDPNEESYVPLLPSFLAVHIERTIQSFALREGPWLKVTTTSETRRPAHGSNTRMGGVTTEAILRILRKDDRWRNVSEWNVDEALNVLKRDGRVWRTGRDRWELTV